MIRIISLLCCLLISNAAHAAAPRDAGVFFFDQTLGDFSEELVLAREQGKRGVLLFFEMDECPFCQRMKDTVLSQPAVQDYFKEHFLIFPVDIEGDIQVVDFDGSDTIEKDFAFRKHRVRATPVFAFFDLAGKRVARYTGPTASAEEFLLLGRYVVEEAYLEMPFTRYKRSQRKDG